MGLEAIRVRAPVVVPHHHAESGRGRPVAEAAREFDQESLQEDALAAQALDALRVRREIAADDHRLWPARHGEREQLIVETALAVKIGGEEPLGHGALRRDGPWGKPGL